jgi:PAS domain S-box-containing protein
MVNEAVRGKPAKGGLRLFLGRVLRWLVEPAAGAAEEDRQKIRLLSGFLLVITISGIIGAIVRQGLGIGTWFNLLAIIIVFAVAYGLSRTRYYKSALIIALVAPALYVISMVVTAGTDSNGIILSLAWLVLPFLLASIFLSRRATLFVAIGYFVFMVSIFPFTTLATEFIGELLAFSLMVVFLVIAIACIRQRDQSRVEKELIRRTEAEEGLRVNEERFRLLADNASDMIIRIQLAPTFKTDYVSPSSERIIGYKPDDFYADPELGLKIVHPEDRKPFLEYISLKNLDHRPVTLRMVRKDGTVIWTEQTFTTIHNHKGKSVAVQAISRDITERKLMEEEIQAEKNKLESLIGAMDCTLTIQDRDFNIIYQNEASKLASGGDHIGEKCYRVYEGRETVCDGCPVAKAFKDGRSNTAERRRLEPSGEITFWENTANPIRDADGKIISCLELARDITERKKAEQALADEATRRHILVDQSLDGIVVLDKDSKVVEANQKFAEMLGYTPEEVLELHTWDWDKQYPPEKLLEMGRNVDEKGLHLETKHHRKDGSVIDVEISINGAMCGGQKLIFCVCRDITERKKAEQALADEATRRRILVDESSDGIVILDEKGKVYEANKRFAEMLGYTPEEVRKLSVWDWEADFPREQVAEMIASVGPEGDHFETHHRRKDGSTFDVEISTNGAVYAGQKLVFCVCRDITARKKAEEALRESGEKLSKAFRSSPNAMALSTVDEGRFLEVNDSFLRDYGYSREEVIGHSSKELGIWVKPKAREHIVKTLRERGQVFDVEFEARIKSGEIRTMTFSAEPIEIEGERCIIASTKDITERKQMVEEIRQSGERYRMIFESANDIIILLDKKGNIVDINSRIGDVGGYSRAQLVGKNFKTLTKIMTKKSAAIIAKNFMLRMLGIDVPPYEVEMYRGDGQKLNIELSAVAVKDKGKVVGNLATLRDITERRKAESAIKYQRELIDQIIATTPNAVMVIDKEMKVLLANDTFYKKFGLKKAGVENKPIASIIKDEELAQAIESTIKNNKKSLSFEFRYELKGMSRIFIATITEMQNKRYLILLNDVTEEREKQERLYLTDRLASVGEMASGVAHELNNPLTSIIGLSSLMARENNIPAETRADLTAINSEAQRCAAIVKNLLAFARKHTTRREPLPVGKIVEDVLKLRAYEHRSHNVIVETDFASDLPEVLGDYFQLQQVFLNIILNAETAMGDASSGGTLRITAERTNGNVRVSFSDDGPGIAKKDLGLIFNPFFTTKAVGKGTGLGLSIAYGIISAHGGKIYARNNNDRGATFVVELPVVDN